ncbi:hypothetical protein B0H16DRAFT_1469688 [Mycena metata]|uniref:Uncharacterized protein n=1 Tax=Mycena metata TaxID=1033252 RepID=A0AAD7HX33_9AGAR|nr:hypothetical protein B0H16DRAFT_1469688 [Mycena metata]
MKEDQQTLKFEETQGPRPHRLRKNHGEVLGSARALKVEVGVHKSVQSVGGYWWNLLSSNSERISTARLVVTEPKDGSAKTFQRSGESTTSVMAYSRRGNGWRVTNSVSKRDAEALPHSRLVRGVLGPKYRFANSGRALVGEFRISDVESLESLNCPQKAGARVRRYIEQIE